MSKMNVFARLTKVDEAKRQVIGVIANEAVDAAGEVFDYESSKPNFVAWSDTVQKASNGASVGNLRAQHGSVVAGRLSEMEMDDVSKSISVVADVVDDNEWNKVLKGCYTGFSIGGKYGSKWTDAKLGKKRYTAVPNEVSLVDLPCNPDATFTFAKADGSSELRKYAAASETAGDDDDEKKADDKGAGKKEAKKEAKAEDAKKAVVAGDLEKALESLRGLGNYDALFKAIHEAQPSKLALTSRLLAKRCADGDEEVKTLLNGAFLFVDQESLAKGLYEVERVASALQTLGWTTQCIFDEARYEKDGSPVPAKFREVVRQLGQALIDLVQEEVSELIASYQTGDPMALNTPSGDMKKEAGADTPAENNNEQLLKGIGDLLEKQIAPQREAVEKLTKTVEEQGKQIDELRKNTPTNGGPRLVDVTKDSELKKGTGGEEEVKPVEVNGKKDDATTLIKQLHLSGGEPLMKSH